MEHNMRLKEKGRKKKRRGKGDTLCGYSETPSRSKWWDETGLVVQKEIFERIREIPWEGGFNEASRLLRIQKASFIISTLNNIYWCQSKKFPSRECFMSIDSRVLKATVGPDYSKIIDQMVEGDLVERIHGYRVSTASRRGQCKKLRINPRLSNGPYVNIFVKESSGFGSRIQTAFELSRTRPLESPSHELIRKNTFRLEFTDTEEVGSLLGKLDKSEDGVQGQMHNIRSLSRRDGDGKNGSLFKTDAYGRIYSSFSNLFRQARPYLRLDGHQLVCLDLHASHWFHALMLWGQQDSRDFGVLSEELRKGDVYQALSDRLGWESRDTTKVPSLKFLHSHPNRMATEALFIAKAIKEVAPSFAEWIREEKLRVAWQDGGFKAFSWRLLREESNRIIVDSVGELMKVDPDYPVITLHDALYVPEGRQGEALKVLESVYETAYGVIPKIETESPEEKIVDFVDPYQFGIEEEAEADAA